MRIPIAATLLLVLFVGAREARAQEKGGKSEKADRTEKNTAQRLFETAEALLDCRVQGNKETERTKLMGTLDKILEKTKFGEGDTARAKMYGAPLKLTLSAAKLTPVLQETVSETTLDKSFVVTEDLRVTGMSDCVVVCRKHVQVTGCTNCLIVCLGDFVCNSVSGSVVFGKTGARATSFTKSLVWDEDGTPALNTPSLTGGGSSDPAIEELRGLLSKRESFAEALRRFRKLRQKSSIPILVEHMTHSQDAIDFEACRSTLVILTGERLAEPSDRTETARRRVLNEWIEQRWNRKRDLGLDLSKFESSRLEAVMNELTATAIEAAGVKRDDLDAGISAERTERALSRLLDREVVKSDVVLPEDVSATMGPALLARASKEADAWPAARLLATLVRKGEAPDLEKAFSEESRTVFARLAAILARAAAGEDFAPAPVVELLDKVRKREEKVAVTLALGRARESSAVLPRLLSLLKDESAEVRDAALFAMGDLRLETMPAEVKELLSKRRWDESVALLHVVSSFRGNMECSELVARSLTEALNDADGRAAPHLEACLTAFERVTGKRFLDRARRDEPDSSRIQLVAKQALEWWKRQGGK
ncbi:hypothetical protein HY251_09160 [bacterium]|nr:hypothetical protein [bacterium]